MDTAELPGNDASWYRALLEDGDAAVAARNETIDSTRRELEAMPTAPEPEEPQPEESQPQALDIPSWLLTHAEAAAIAPDDAADDEPSAHEAADNVPPDNALDVAAEDQAAEMPVTDEPPVEEASLLIDESPETPAGITEPVAGEAATTEPAAETEPDRELSPGEKTSEMVGKLWTASAPDGHTDEVWEPDEMDRKITSSRSFRWPTVIALVAVVGLVVVGLVLLPSITRSRANAYRESIMSALHNLRTELPDTQTSLEVATEPDSTMTDLRDLSTQLTALNAKASTVDAVGREPLPSSPPLTSSEPIDELAPIRQRLEPLATTALTIQRRIANLVEYRTLMSGFLVLPELPTEADSPQQADLRVALASAQAESASIIADLPDDVSLSDHRAMAREINDGFANWQVDYLEALRTRDTITAGILITDLITQLEQLDAELVTPLAQIRRQTDADLIDLARSVDEVAAMANGQELSE